MIKVVDRDDFGAEPNKETLVPLPVAGVAQSTSPQRSLTTFLTTLVVHDGSSGCFLIERSILP